MTIRSNMAFDPIQHQVDQWYRDYGPSVAKYIRWKFKGSKVSDEEVNEIIQDVFLNALRYLRGPACNPINYPRQWLLGIADNAFTQHKRKNSNLVVSYDAQDYMRENLPDDETNQPEIIVFGEYPELVGALNKLSPSQRQATYLHYGQDLTYVQISDMSGRPPEKEGRDARNGLEKLRRYYLHPEEE